MEINCLSNQLPLSLDLLRHIMKLLSWFGYTYKSVFSVLVCHCHLNTLVNMFSSSSYHGYCSFWPCVLPCAALKSYMLLSDATQRRAISDSNANAYSVFYCSKKHWDLSNANAAANADANADANAL